MNKLYPIGSMAWARKETILFWARCLVSLFLVYLVWRLINPAQLARVLLSAKWSLVLVVFALTFLDRFLMVYRLVLLLKALNIRPRFVNVLKIFFVSNFAGNFLPSSMAPDLLRAYMLRTYGNMSLFVSAVLVDRMIGFSSLMVVVIMAFGMDMWFAGGSNILTAGAVVFSVLGVLLSAMLLFVTGKRSLIWKIAVFMGYRPERAIWLRAKRVYEASYCLRRNPKAWVSVLGISFINHAVAILSFYCIATSLSISIRVFHVFIIVPIAILLSLLPISLSGLGVQEGTYVVSLAQLGVPIQDGVALSIILRALMIISTLVGAVFYMREGLGSPGYASIQTHQPSHDF